MGDVPPQPPGGSIAPLIVNLLFVALHVAGMWRVFAKAGQPPWAALVPIYNFVILLKVAGKPLWWLVLFLVPVVNVVFMILTAIGVAKAFGKSTGFGVLLAVLGPIFFAILGFGSAQYQGPPSGASAAA